ncbi:SMP-30/gluconolactonase/LRE family protein [Kitasatospora camelliae]|uniref:Superoxide dismutase n=1 Tax=Kitasatospora camelliae TaxID=3156397 RepID=A0AAU8K0H8_9ACTN
MSATVSRRRLFGLGAAVGAAVLLDPLGSSARAATDSAEAESCLPNGFPLPNGFNPEGITIDALGRAYLGSLANGDIYRASLATGQGEVISAGLGPGSPSLGLKIDGRGRLFVSGGWGGDARVIDARTGAILASYHLATSADTFVNDVVLTPGMAWFTESAQPVLYGLPLAASGRLPDPSEVVRLPLSGDFEPVPQGSVGSNGIETTPDGTALLVVNMTTGSLYRIDPRTGVARRTDLGGADLVNGDGLLRQGRELFAVRNFSNEVAVVKLDRTGLHGEITRRITDPRFRIPATVAAYRDRLYIPNGRFDTPPTPTTDYDVVAVPRG